MKSLTDIQIEAGLPYLPGIHKIGDKYNFTIEAPEKAQVSLLLYHRNGKKPAVSIPLDEKTRSGRVRSVLLSNIPLTELDYNYLVDDKVEQDTYARAVVGHERFGEAVSEDPHQLRCRYTTGAEYDWEEDVSPDFSFHDMILYKLHVRGFTKAAGPAVKKKGTLTGLAEMIPYFQELGINTIELMPVYSFMEVSVSAPPSGLIIQKTDNSRINYWGYEAGLYFAPKRAYCATDDPEKEMKDLVKALHKAGIKCILEFYFPGEVNPSCALRALQFWKLNYHVDGFHVTGSALTPEVLLCDGILSDTMILLPGFRPELGTRDKNLPPVVAEINTGFMEDMRRFLKSDEGMVESAMWRTRRSGKDHGVINYMASQDGFTLYDMVTYNYRHNDANGEENQDGSSFNYSWNCGVEGPSRKQAIKKLREKQIRNAVLLLLLSQGTPMIYAGDEFGNSQDGNNNAWCQDNPTGWVDWKSYKRMHKLYEFVQTAIRFRKERPILHLGGELIGADYLGKGFPDVSYHGERAWYVSRDNTSRMFGVMYYGGYTRKEDDKKSRRQFIPEDFLYIAYNFHWEERSFALPSLPEGIVWQKVADTSLDWDSCFVPQEGELVKTMETSGRSIVVLQGKKSEKPSVKKKTVRRENEK